MKKAFNAHQEKLLARWKELGARLGIDDTAAGRRLVAGHNAPGRFYHNQNHLEAVLAELDWAREHVKAPARRFDIIELALWYHDAVYDATRHDNEAQSLALFLKDAKKFGLSAPVKKEVARLIDITAHHKDAKTLAEKIMTDCDLAILGASPAAFHRYDANIRKEYAHVPATAYKAARHSVLKGFLDQPSIFKTPTFQQKLEAQARKNLTDSTATTPGRKHRAASKPSSR